MVERYNLRSETASPNHMAKTIAKIFGVIVLLLGIIGFFSNGFIGSTGYFLANTGLDIVNVILGIALLAMSTTEDSAGLSLKIVGGVYFVLALIGFLLMPATGISNVLGFMSFNTTDNWLYIVLGVLLFASGFAEERGMASMGAHAHG